MKKDYMARLERAARWRLPRQEAEDVISDYRDIVGDPPRPEEELRRDVGDPEQVIKLLVSPPRAYRIWQAVFIVMAAIILAVGFSGTFIGYPLWRLLFDGWINRPYGAYLTFLGATLALVWFRWKGQKTGRLSKAVPILLAVFLAFIGTVLWFCWIASCDYDAFLTMWGQIIGWIGPNRGTKISASFYLLRSAMIYGSAVISVVGTYSLVRARTDDRRWSSVYVLALAAIIMALLVVDWTGRMDVASTILTVEEEMRQMLTRCAVITAVSLVGTGVALC